MESLLCLIIKQSLIAKERMLNLQPKPSWAISRRQMCPEAVRLYLLRFQWSQRFSLRYKQAKNMHPSTTARVYSQMLKASLTPMTFHHLPNRLLVIPIEIKKNSLFWETTSCRTGSRTQFLSLTLKTKTGIFETAEVSSNSYRAKTMMLWFKSWK